MSDVGKRFLARRVLELEITLDESDVLDQVAHGETAEQSAVCIAGCTPSSDWLIVGDDIEAL